MRRQPGSSQFLKEYRMPIELRFDDLDLREEPASAKSVEADTSAIYSCEQTCTCTTSHNTCYTYLC